MRGFLLALFLVGFACSSPQKDRIVVPTLHAGFYNDALDRINDKLESDPDNDRLIDQKLFYCDQLDWPTTCISALDTYKEKHGMTNQLVEQYIVYYTRHKRYQLLLDIIDRWGQEYHLADKYIKTYIESLARLGKRKKAEVELRIFLKNHQSLDDLEFASTQYLRLKDTLMAAYNLRKVYQKNPESDLMWNYGSILVNLGYNDEGLDVLDHYVKEKKDDIDIQLQYARLLEKSNRLVDARKVIKPFTERDTISYLLVEWYKKDQMWDSATYVLNEVIASDSSDRKPIWKLGRMYEDRGWLLTSLPYYEYLLELNSNDTLAQQRIDLIQRKIAYLQRLKFEENKTPTLELQPKKIEN